MPSVAVLVLLVIVPGALVLVTSFHAAMQLNLNAKVFLAAMEKLLRNQRRERARLLSRASNAPVAVVARHALDLRLPRFDPEGHGGDYRKAPGQDFEERVRETLAPVVEAQLARYRLSLYSSVLALVSLGTATALVWREGVHGMAGVGWAALGLGLLAALLNVRRYLRAKGDLAWTVDAFAPFVERE